MKRFIYILAVLISIQSFGQVTQLSEIIYFNTNQSSLTSLHKRKLDSLVALMKASYEYNADIKGYADNLGRLSLNISLSKMRALNAYNYLVEKGIDKSKLSHQGMGISSPIGDNKTPRGRALNRRDDIEVLLTQASTQPTAVEPPKPVVPVAPVKPTPPPPPPTPKVELGPNYNSGKLVINADKIIEATSGIVLLVNKNSLVTTTQDPIDFEFKDYTPNKTVIDKTIQTKDNNCKAMTYHGGFSTSFVQNYQDLAINRQDPIKVLIPGEYNPNVALYNYPRSWTPDTINTFTYNYTKKAYEVGVLEENQTFGLLERPEIDTPEFLRIKITGLNAKHIKPYVIYDDCSISNGCQYSGDNFIFPIVKSSNSYRIRASYKDYDSNRNTTTYSNLKYDLSDIHNTDKFKTTLEQGVRTYRFKEAIKFENGELVNTDDCEKSAAKN